MKKVLLLTAALVYSAAAMAQDGFQLGVKAGGNDSGYLGSDSEADQWENRYGAHLGVFLSIPITPKTFSIQPEVQYSMKGANHFEDETNNGGDINDFKIRQHHIDVPVMAVLRARFLYFELGPVASFLVKANSDVDGMDDFTDDFRKVGIGAAGGIGLMTEGGFMFGGRYSFDFNKLMEDAPNYKNSLLQAYVGWLFGGRPGAELSTMGSE